MFYFFFFEILNCIHDPVVAGFGAATGQYNDFDSMKHKVYFGHSLEHCESKLPFEYNAEPYLNMDENAGLDQ